MDNDFLENSPHPQATMLKIMIFILENKSIK